MKKVCVITGTRAEYGLLYWTLKALEKEPAVDLQICVTGMHLSPEFGLTYQQIEADGFTIDYKVETLLSSDTGTAIAKSIGLGTIGFADAFQQLQPDVILVVGDRFEILAAVTAALAMRIPVAHCHGGELTKGAIDEAIRHSITKMSHLHFVSTSEYKKRVIQLGEAENRVFEVGALGLENIDQKLISKEEFEKRIGRPLAQQNFIITYHPETLSKTPIEEQLMALFDALDQFPDTLLVFTQPNADHQGRLINEKINTYVAQNIERAVFFPTLGNSAYLTALSLMDLVIGNSSSGIIEAPSFGTPTINIGNRQKGRVQAKSIINAPAVKKDIIKAIESGLNLNKRNKMNSIINPYKGEFPSKVIVEKLRSIEPKGLMNKAFNDLNESYV
jgi:GDP/UDP-N,N'-diacetylbacillosamine 2-epimerase (hydrolysing)